MRRNCHVFKIKHTARARIDIPFKLFHLHCCHVLSNISCLATAAQLLGRRIFIKLIHAGFFFFLSWRSAHPTFSCQDCSVICSSCILWVLRKGAQRRTLYKAFFLVTSQAAFQRSEGGFVRKESGVSCAVNSQIGFLD